MKTVVATVLTLGLSALGYSIWLLWTVGNSPLPAVW